eukprot:TRINITY_DN5198_c0_g1_i2.p1 TRINITY_DN5198_c0_g1~~TRINITY_DN5198_c0_g1_i2.p1  ORF type:complete len:566 (-),score=119.80 TRINITY_DN5198_c0_g1_i2:264-1889(-)
MADAAACVTDPLIDDDEEQQPQVTVLLADDLKVQHETDIILMGREARLAVPRGMLLEMLAKDMGNERESFLLFGSKINSTVRSWYSKFIDQLLHVYRLFDPNEGNELIKAAKLTPEEVDQAELAFLEGILFIMDKSNYSMVTDEEEHIAQLGEYRLELNCQVDEEKIDETMIKRFLAKHPVKSLPSFTEKGYYLMFRSGIGIDRFTGDFWVTKYNILVFKLLHFLSCYIFSRKKEPQVHDLRHEGDKGSLENCFRFERILVDDLYITLGNLVNKVTVQEATFKRLAVLYRPTAGENVDPAMGNRSIIIRHFNNVPMADLEIVYPEKKVPSLTPTDWISMLITIVTGLTAVIMSCLKEFSLNLIAVVVAGVAGYLYKIYSSFYQSLARYNMLLYEYVSQKNLDSGLGSLLHICQNALEQEVKEVLLAYYILLKQGPTDVKTLEQRCEQFTKDRLKLTVRFDVSDAIGKLMRLDIIRKEGKTFSARPLHEAMQCIGDTNDEMFASITLHEYPSNENSSYSNEGHVIRTICKDTMSPNLAKFFR